MCELREPALASLELKSVASHCLCRLMSSGFGLVNRFGAILGLKSVATLVCAD